MLISINRYCIILKNSIGLIRRQFTFLSLSNFLYSLETMKHKDVHLFGVVVRLIRPSSTLCLQRWWLSFNHLLLVWVIALYNTFITKRNFICSRVCGLMFTVWYLGTVLILLLTSTDRNWRSLDGKFGLIHSIQRLLSMSCQLWLCECLWLRYS